MTSPAAASERGSAALVSVAFLGVLVLVGAALGVVAAMVRDHREAQSAADLAALAGAHALAAGQDPCAAARSLASANGVQLSQCEVAGSDVRVVVVVTGPHWLGERADLVAESRAGPGEPT